MDRWPSGLRQQSWKLPCSDVPWVRISPCPPIKKGSPKGALFYWRTVWVRYSRFVSSTEAIIFVNELASLQKYCDLQLAKGEYNCNNFFLAKPKFRLEKYKNCKRINFLKKNLWTPSHPVKKNFTRLQGEYNFVF